MTNKELSVISRKLSPIERDAQDLEITDQKTMGEANEYLSKLNKIGDAMKAEKNKTLLPAQETVAAIKAQWKPLETIYEGAISLIRRKMSSYQTEAKRLADEEADRIAARIGEGKGKLKAGTAMRQMSEIETPEKSVAGDQGMTKFKTVPKFEVVDLSKIPLEYHLANDVAIRKAMIAGVKLDGVRYFSEEIPMNYR